MENKDLIPIDEIRELVAEGKLIEKPKDNNLNLITKINEEFNDYIEQDEAGLFD